MKSEYRFFTDVVSYIDDFKIVIILVYHVEQFNNCKKLNILTKLFNKNFDQKRMKCYKINKNCFIIFQNQLFKYIKIISS